MVSSFPNVLIRVSNMEDCFLIRDKKMKEARHLHRQLTGFLVVKERED